MKTPKTAEIEQALKAGIRAAEKVTKQSMDRLNSAGDDEKTIEAKIEKKQKELERNQKRLRQLKQLRFVLPLIATGDFRSAINVALVFIISLLQRARFDLNKNPPDMA